MCSSISRQWFRYLFFFLFEVEWFFPIHYCVRCENCFAWNYISCICLTSIVNCEFIKMFQSQWTGITVTSLQWCDFFLFVYLLCKRLMREKWLINLGFGIMLIDITLDLNVNLFFDRKSFFCVWCSACVWPHHSLDWDLVCQYWD